MRRTTEIDLVTGGMRARPDDVTEQSPDTFADRGVRVGSGRMRFDPVDA